MALIKQLNFPAIEIALDIHRDTIWDWELLQEEVITSTANRMWLHHPALAELEAQARAAARALADAAESQCS